MLCQFRNFLGQLNKGVHKYRIANIAIVDVLATIVVAYLIHLYTVYSFPIILAGAFILGIIAHRLFCVRTTIDKFLFK
jgi:hypothetical protein